MHMINASSEPHEHDFLGADQNRNERRVWMVIALTAAMMVLEIAAGSLYGSMALVADGWHMSTHAGAMLITALTYLYARRHRNDARFTFGTGKLGDLGGFASAIVLALISLLIGWESLLRFANPVAIDFNQAILVAILGLVINLVCAWLLKDDHSHHHHGHGHGLGHAHHSHGHDHSHPHEHSDHQHDHRHEAHHGSADHGRTDHGHAHHGTDNNLRAAYLHVLADALTSILAIAALLVGRSYGWVWADPLMGIVGALVIARWSWGLIRDAGAVLLDRTSEDDDLPNAIRRSVEHGNDKITDLHVWQVGPGHHAAIVALVTRDPKAPSYYKDKLAHLHGLSHVTVEVEPTALQARS